MLRNYQNKLKMLLVVLILLSSCSQKIAIQNNKPKTEESKKKEAIAFQISLAVFLIWYAGFTTLSD